MSVMFSFLQVQGSLISMLVKETFVKTEIVVF